MQNDAPIATFPIHGKPFSLRRGRISPNTPAFHIVDQGGKHVSLAFPEDGGGFLFDMLEADGTRAGYRLGADRKATQFPTKSAYWKARTAAGWPAFRKASP